MSWSSPAHGIIFGNEFKTKEEASKAAADFQNTLPALQESEYKDDVVLITGANKGLGYETARKLGAKGFRVLLGSRDSERGRAAEHKLQEQNKSAFFQFVQLDVTSTESIAAAAEIVRSQYGRLDVLINNAGIAAGFAQPSEVEAENARKVIETNLIAPITVTKAFLPLLQKSSHPRIVNVSSVVGAHFAHRYPDGGHVDINVADYCSSKAGLNLYTVLLANEFLAKKSNLRANSVCPGYTATDLNRNTGTQTVDEGTEAIVAASLIAPNGPTGTYFNRYGFMAV